MPPGNTHMERVSEGGSRREKADSPETLGDPHPLFRTSVRGCCDSTCNDRLFQKWIQAESDTRGRVCQGTEREFLGMRRCQRQGKGEILLLSRGAGGRLLSFSSVLFPWGTLQAKGRFGSSELTAEYSVFIKDVCKLDGWIVHIGFSLIR